MTDEDEEKEQDDLVKMAKNMLVDKALNAKIASNNYQAGVKKMNNMAHKSSRRPGNEVL